jgi:hypothetical protein
MKSLLTFIVKLLQLIWIFITDNLKTIGKKYPEVFTIPLTFAIWLLSAGVLRLIDPTAAIFDAGVLQIPLFAILLLYVFLSVTWITMGLLFSTARNYLKKELKSNFYYLSKWEKIKYSSAVFFLLFLSLIALSFVLS